MNAILTEEVKNKWGKLLDESKFPKIRSELERNNTIRVLENTVKALKEDNVAADMQNFDPVLINLVRRTAPSLVANDLVGVQPMTGPTGLVFAMRVHYEDGATGTRTETWNENAPDATKSGPYATATAEILGKSKIVNTADAGAAQDPVKDKDPWNQMAFTIDKMSVTAKTRALKSAFTNELAQDLKAIHGLDAETELTAILSGEIIAEVDREIVAEINRQAIPVASGYTYNGTAVNAGAGVVDLATAGFDGRWTVEKHRQLIDIIDRQAQLIARRTRRGKGNFILCSANVAAALESAGTVKYLSDGNGIVQPDVTGIAYVGVLNNRYKMYVDPYSSGDYVTIGYKGPNVYDAGIFYAPYVPLQMYKAIGQDDFQPRIGFKTRYALACNPYAPNTSGVGTDDLNPYFVTFTVNGL